MRNIGNRTHVVIRSAELLDCVRSYPGVNCVRTKQFERVVDVNLRPLGQKLLDSLLDL